MNARCLAAALALIFGVSSAALGQAGQDFYKGKTLRMIVGHQVGNDYDVGARLLAKYLPRHIPGQPSVIVQNMIGAGGIASANYLYLQAPRDGTVLGSFTRNMPNQKLMGLPNVEADPRRFNWLGATSFPGRVCTAWQPSPIKTPADLFTTELIVGGSGAGSSLSILPTVFNHVLGTKFRIVEGYKGTQDALLAVERGELQGVCASYGQFRAYERLFKEGKLRIIFRAEEVAMPEIPDAPSIYDYAKNEEQKQFMRFVFSSVEFGRPYVLPPDVPADRAAVLRKAVAEAAQDPELIAEASKMKLDMTFRPPQQIEQLLTRLYATPPDMVEAVKKLVPNMQ